MDKKRKYELSGGDYLALGIALLISITIWFVKSMGQTYSAIVQSPVRIVTSVDGRSDKSDGDIQVAARCQMSGAGILTFRLSGSKFATTLKVSPEDIHYYGDDYYYLPPSSLSKYFHDIFGDDAKLEYFVTDTLYFRLAEVSGKKVKVNAVSSIRYRPQHMAVAPLKVEPDSVMIYGDEKALSLVDRVNTMMISRSDVSESVFGEVGLEQIKGIRIGADKVSYSIYASRFAEIVSDIALTAEGVPDGVNFKIIPAVAKVTVKMIYPCPNSAPDLKLSIKYEDFLASRSGKCVPELSGMNDYVLKYTIEPEVFDCMIVTQ